MQQGGSQSQYGAPPPDVTPFASGTGRSRADHVLGASAPEHLQQQQAQPVAEAASPISSRAPPRGNSLDELPGPGCFPDEDALAAAAGEEAEPAVGPPGNRWPRQETLALLRIRSEMDAVFRDATLKAPLWEDVSRKLAELGYRRSAKKCKEKFENVHKYYKRTKDGRAGRQDGKSYRFFSQLEALHSSGGAAPTAAASPLTAPATSGSVPNTVTSSIGMVGSPSAKFQPTPLNAIPPSVATAPLAVPDPMAAASGPPGGISFSATSSSSASESEDDTEEGLTGQPRKRKRRGGGGVGRKMMAFFEGLMRQVMERQEAMQQRFLEAIEKREQDRMIREEAWKRQEVARLSREHEMMAQERTMSASRDAAIITFLQKMTGQTVPVPPLVPEAAPPQRQVPSQQHPPPAPASPPPPEQTRPQPQQTVPVVRSQALTLDIVPLSEVPEGVTTGGGSSSMDPASSRWPKSEVHALIQVRSELDSRYQEAGPKGPLWEEVAGRMQRLGYNRSSKRCKEKWENINKYFKKVKESNKKRPEDSKTCPYFHQLETLYRKKLHVGGAGSSSLSDRAEQQVLAAEPLPQPPPPPKAESTQGKCIDGGGGDNNDNGGGNPGGNGGPSSSSQKTQKTSNGALKHGIFDEGPGGGGSVKKPEDIVKELMDDPQQQRQHKTILISNYDNSEELDTDEDGDEDDDDGEMDYRIHNYLQRAGVNGTSNGAASAAAGSFMAMMQ